MTNEKMSPVHSHREQMGIDPRTIRLQREHPNHSATTAPQSMTW